MLSVIIVVSGLFSPFRALAVGAEQTPAIPQLATPTDGYMGFGWTGDGGHRGVDIWTKKATACGCLDAAGCAGAPGNEVKAAYPGSVAAIYWGDHQGQWRLPDAPNPNNYPLSVVVLKHIMPGTDSTFYTLYEHLANNTTSSSYIDTKLTIGAQVEQYQVLGRQGNWRYYGTNALITHLHFEVALAVEKSPLPTRRTLDPMLYLNNHYTTCDGQLFASTPAAAPGNSDPPERGPSPNSAGNSKQKTNSKQKGKVIRQNAPPPPPVPAPVPAPQPPEEQVAANPHVSLDVTSGPPGTAIKATGEGFLANTSVSVSEASPVGKRAVNTISADGKGSFTMYFKVSAPTLPGRDTITFTQEGKSVSVIFTITGAAPPANKPAPGQQQDKPKPQPAAQPKLAPYASLSPEMGPSGTVVNASGGGWAPNKPVTVTQSGSNASGGGGTITADANGDIDSNFRIADGTQPGTLTITFRQGSSIVTDHFEVE